VSNTVVPFTLPGRPESVDAATLGNQRGAITVRWAAAVDNGRPVTKYVVKAGERSVEVADTAATLTGLPDGANVPVTVHAVNEAGDGPPGTATARTVAPPKVTVTNGTADYDSATVRFTVDAGGGQATCSMSTAGRPAVSGNCSSLTVDGLKPNTPYTFTVTATNAAGSGTAQKVQDTAVLTGVATCRNGQNGDTRTYCDKDRPNERNGNEIFRNARQENDEQVGWVEDRTTLKAYCKKKGDKVVDSYIYNSQKKSDWWVQVDYSGRNYIPWAWLNLQNGDNLNALPNC
jgi:hypothetical protein